MSILTDLRAVLDHIESEPVLRDAKYCWLCTDGVAVGAWNADQLAAMVRALHGTIDTPVIKEPREHDSYRVIKRMFGQCELRVIDYTNDRCERVQVGTKLVEKQVVVVEAVTRTEIVDEPIFAWHCGPVLVATLNESPTTNDQEPF